MGKLYLAWPNRMTDTGAALSGGSWRATLPLSHLLVRTPTVIARSVDLAPASTQFDLTLPATRAVKAFAFVNHNLSPAAQWRITLGSSLGASDAHDSGWLPVWRLSFDNGVLEWESDGWWSGAYDDDYVGHPFAAIYLAPGTPAARFVRVEISDPDNPAGYVQIGRFFAGGGISPEFNMIYGMSDGWDDSSVVETAIGGSEYFDERRRARTVKFELPYISQDTEFRQFYEMHRRLGTTGEVLYLPDAADMAACQLTGFVGRMRQLSAIEYPYYRARTLGFELKELL